MLEKLSGSKTTQNDIRGGVYFGDLTKVVIHMGMSEIGSVQVELQCMKDHSTMGKCV